MQFYFNPATFLIYTLRKKYDLNLERPVIELEQVVYFVPKLNTQFRYSCVRNLSVFKDTLRS